MLFEMGNVVMTSNIASVNADDSRFSVEIMKSLNRHAKGDWGEMGAEDKALNDDALKNGSRIFSAYKTSKGKIWIITEAENDNGKREYTTILFPSDY